MTQRPQQSVAEEQLPDRDAVLGRRDFLGGTGVALAFGSIVASCAPGASPAERGLARLLNGEADWGDVRALFPLNPDYIDMSAMLITSHPKPVSEAIDRHRAALDKDPVIYLQMNSRKFQDAARTAAGQYLGIDHTNIALTDSTTMGVALVYNGLRLRPGDEILTTEQDYYVTHESLRLAAERTGIVVRRIPLYEDIEGISAEAVIDRLVREIRPRTRALALTWVHSSTGLKIPAREISAAVARINANRDEEDQLLFALDSVHGFGNQDMNFDEIGCDFLMSGCHKWLFGPRGTGIVAATERGWRSLAPTIPSFLHDEAYSRWMRNDPPPPMTGSLLTPGGFKAYEHLWSLTEAFDMHRLIGRKKIAERTAVLALQLKEGLKSIQGVKLMTPLSAELSAGIVSFDIGEMSPWTVVEQLREQKIIASVAPYARKHVRLTPSVRNSPEEIEKVLRAVRDLAGGPVAG